MDCLNSDFEVDLSDDYNIHIEPDVALLEIGTLVQVNFHLDFKSEVDANYFTSFTKFSAIPFEITHL